MKIAYIALRGVPLSDGISQYTDDLARALVKKGHEVIVYTSRRYGNKTGLFDNSYKIITVPSIPFGFAEKMSIVFFASIHQFFHKYDVVHYHAMGPSIFAFLGRKRKRAVVIQSHGVEYERSKHGSFAKRVLKCLEKQSINLGDELIVCSNALKKHFIEEYNKETILIYNAVRIPTLRITDKSVFEKNNIEQNNYYLYMARITEEKGLHYLINAFNRLQTNKKLVVAGPLNLSIPYHKKIYELAKGNKNIIFPGFVSGEEKANLFRGAYCFILPSELEGFSIGLLEAMSYSKCCIISNIPNNMEAAGDDCCIPFVSGDENSLHEKMRDVEENSQLVISTGERARKRIINCFSEENLVNSMENLYTTILNNKKKKRK